MKQGIAALCGHGVGTRGLWEHLRGVPLPVRSVVAKVVRRKLVSGRETGSSPSREWVGSGPPAEATE